MQIRIPTFYPTESQRKWIEAEKKRTGNSFAAILRNLMQEKIDNEH